MLELKVEDERVELVSGVDEEAVDAWVGRGLVEVDVERGDFETGAVMAEVVEDECSTSSSLVSRLESALPLDAAWDTATLGADELPAKAKVTSCISPPLDELWAAATLAAAVEVFPEPKRPPKMPPPLLLLFPLLPPPLPLPLPLPLFGLAGFALLRPSS